MDRLTASSAALLTCGLLCAPLASALGVGAASMASKLGEPLRVTIPIYGATGLSSEQVLVTLHPARDAASDSDMGGVNVRELTVESRIDASGQGQIWLRGKGNAQEPFVNFSVELRWPNGTLTREYTLLLDLPRLVVDASAPGQGPKSPSQEVPAALPAAGPSGPRPATPDFSSAAFYLTQRGDSLWRIAAAVSAARGGGVTAMMQQILAANPSAFVRGKPALLKEAVRLDLRPASLAAAGRQPAPGPAIPPVGYPAQVAAEGPATPSAAAHLAGQMTRAGAAVSGPLASGPAMPQGGARSEPVAPQVQATAEELQALQDNLLAMREQMAALQAELGSAREALAQVRAEKRALEAIGGSADTPPQQGGDGVVAQPEVAKESTLTAWISAVVASLVLVAILLVLRRRLGAASAAGREAMPSAAAPENFDDVFAEIGNLPKTQAASVPELATAGAAASAVPEPESFAASSAEFDLDGLDIDDIVIDGADHHSGLSTQLSLLEFYAQLGDSPAFENLLAHIDQTALLPEEVDVIKRAAASLETQKQLRA